MLALYYYQAVVSCHNDRWSDDLLIGKRRCVETPLSFSKSLPAMTSKSLATSISMALARECVSQFNQPCLLLSPPFPWAVPALDFYGSACPYPPPFAKDTSDITMFCTHVEE